MFFRLVCLLKMNTIELVNYEGENIGIGLFLLGSKFNHSCIPNVMFYPTHEYHLNVLKFRALRDILPGEELVISYTRLALLFFPFIYIFLLVVVFTSRRRHDKNT